MTTRIRIFNYLPHLDAFQVTEEYRAIADDLGLSEWNPVVWIGRLFTMDNDVGEHWFDNWEERADLQEQAKEHGVDENSLMIIVPARFADGRDGPCNSPELRAAFWKDVLRSLELSDQLLFDQARNFNETAKSREDLADDVIPDLEARIASWIERFESKRTKGSGADP